MDKLRGLLNTTLDSFFWGMDPYIYGLMQARPHPWKRGSLDAFNQSVDSRRQYLQNFRQNNPITAGAGEVGGGLFLAGGMGKAMHSMGQDILRKAMGKQPPPVDISRPVHTQKDLVEMSRRRFNQGLLATGVATSAPGLLGVLGKQPAKIKSAVSSLRTLNPDAVSIAKRLVLPKETISFLKEFGWDANAIRDHYFYSKGLRGRSDLDSLSPKAIDIDGKYPDGNYPPEIQKGLDEIFDEDATHSFENSFLDAKVKINAEIMQNRLQNKQSFESTDIHNAIEEFILDDAVELNPEYAEDVLNAMKKRDIRSGSDFYDRFLYEPEEALEEDIVEALRRMHQ